MRTMMKVGNPQDLTKTEQNTNNITNFGKNPMEQLNSEILIVSPSFAKGLLSNNFGNRLIRKSHVKTLAQAIKKGAWKLSPQGVVIHKSSGRLLDGQHRLHAVVESGMDVPMFFIYTDDEEIFKVLDQGVKRSMSDIFSVDSRVMDTVNFCTRVALDARSTVAPHQVEPLLNSSVGKLASELVEFCPIVRKGFSTAPFKGAVVVSTVFGADKDYTFSMYKDFVNFNVDNLPPVGKAFLRQINAGSISFSKGQTDNAAFMKFLKVFDPKNKDLNVIRLSSGSNAVSSITDVSKKLKQALIQEGSINETWGARL